MPDDLSPDTTVMVQLVEAQLAAPLTADESAALAKSVHAMAEAISAVRAAPLPEGSFPATTFSAYSAQRPGSSEVSEQ